MTFYGFIVSDQFCPIKHHTLARLTPSQFIYSYKHTQLSVTIKIKIMQLYAHIQSSHLWEFYFNRCILK